MCKISKVIGREILDSRGIPTVEADVYLKNGIIGRASVPSGASTGSKECLELRDKNKNYFFGMGVTKSVSKINKIISKEIIGMNVNDQSNIDKTMIETDGTYNKSNIGANSILAVSLAVLKAASLYNKLEPYEYIAEICGNKNLFMPIPMINILNGGKHSNNNIDIQEFMIQPFNSKSFKNSVRIGSEIFHILGRMIKKMGFNTSVGDEGGYSINLPSNEEALVLMKKAVNLSNFEINKDVVFSIDCAASEFFNKKENLYVFSNENKKFTSKQFTNYLKDLSEKYPIVSIEDGLHENDINGYIYQTNLLKEKIKIVGDDLFATNYILLKKYANLGIANSIIIKPNQIGTFTETIKTIKLANKLKYSTIVSHRSGETEDTIISDLAVGTKSKYIKIGSMSRVDRISKYNRLIRIEEMLLNNI
ncbi:MAG: phosphopyruvate hydratase [Enterobacteriaceae bacterium]